MITATVSFMVAPGRNAEALEYFHTLIREAKKLTGVEARLLTQLGGPMAHFVVSSSYNTIAEWDERRTKLQSDAHIQKMIADAGKSGLFIPGSVTSAIWQQV